MCHKLISYKSALSIAWMTTIVMAFTTCAHAFGGVTCKTENENAHINIGLHRVPIYSPVFADAHLDDTQWATIPQFGEEELGESQGIIRDNTLTADFIDPDATKLIISLFVDYSGEEQEDGYPGTLTFEDGIAREVFCEFD